MYMYYAAVSVINCGILTFWQVYWSLEYFNTELTWLKLVESDYVAVYRFYWLNAGSKTNKQADYRHL